MTVCRYLGLQERDCVRPARFTQVVKRKARTLPRMHGRVPLHIRQREIALAIATVGCSEQREESGVLRQGQVFARHKTPSL